MAVRHVLHPAPRAAIIRLSIVFQKICCKVVNPAEMAWLKQYVAETLCLLEAWFPPSFWDIMSHLVIHLVDELCMCGPVACRWMYPIEWYLGVLKKNVRNMSLPEGSIAEGYIVDEALGLCTEYLQNFPHTRRRIWDEEEEASVTGIVLQGRGTPRTLSLAEVRVVHTHVITNSVATEPYSREYDDAKNELDRQRAAFQASQHRRGRVQYPDDLALLPDFATWLQGRVRSDMSEGRVVDEMASTLAFPPAREVLTFRSCDAYGNHYRVYGDDSAEGFTTYDCGIALVCAQPCRSRRADRNLVEVALSYVGILREIIQVMYNQTPLVIFRGSWVPPHENGNASIKRDSYRFWMADFRRRQQELDQPFVFPQHVRHVFFHDDAREPGWKVVLQNSSRSARVVNDHENHVLGVETVNIELDAIHHANVPGVVPGVGHGGDGVVVNEGFAEDARLPRGM